jgi:hypothetical protein
MPRPARTDGKRKGTRRLDTPKRHDAVKAGVTVEHPMPNGGIPQLELVDSVLYEAAKTHASYDQLGRIFGVSGAHVQQTYSDLVEKARAEACKNLLSAQFTTAIQDRNPTMQIWLGKQYLGQKDVSRTEHTGPEGAPIETKNQNINRAVAYIPENGRDEPNKLPEGGALVP